MPPELYRHTPTEDADTASLTVDSATKADYRVPPPLYAKFAEHLGWNVYHGMDAQILFNPTVGDWPFPAGTAGKRDGGQHWETDSDAIHAQIDEFAALQEFPASKPLKAAYDDGGAFWWMRRGDEESVQFSPDTGPTGDRAQRVEVHEASPASPGGMLQWVYLPVHRTRTFELEARLRAAEDSVVRIGVATTTSDGRPDERVASAEVSVAADWMTMETTLEIPDSVEVADDELFAFTVTVDSPANLVVDRVLLYPDDHRNYADPDVIEYLSDADLPLLRWPGGNFVSGYHWRDGVGPRDARPTVPNPAWGGLEYNLFGTDEFVAFCEAVGCEPMLCVNAGDGTPEEAAKWVEYCNGSIDTEMGRLRAEHGHPDPYDVTHWEIGNELYGKWQVHWTTPAGNADRYEQFRDAMTAVDSSIKVKACGNRKAYDGEWNTELLQRSGETVRCLTDHVLAGGRITSESDPDELFHAFMGFAEQLGDEYRDLCEQMAASGVDDPRLAITELQLFARLTGDGADDSKLPAAWRFSRRMPKSSPFPSKKTVSEALYDATVIHECIRTGEFVEMVTHSATVNHGGGLQKRKERVWADPCHYGHVMGSALADGRPVAVDVECTTIATDEAFGQIEPVEDAPVLDAVAVTSDDEDELLLMIVHRSSATGPIEVSLDVGSFTSSATIERTELSAATFTAENTYEQPERITPTTSTLTVSDGSVKLTIPPFSLTRLSIPED